MPAAFPFTLFWHTWLKKLCFHPEKYVSFLVNIMKSIDQKFLLPDSVLYDFDDPSTNVYMVIKVRATLAIAYIFLVLRLYFEKNISLLMKKTPIEFLSKPMPNRLFQKGH